MAEKIVLNSNGGESRELGGELFHTLKQERGDEGVLRWRAVDSYEWSDADGSTSDELQQAVELALRGMKTSEKPQNRKNYLQEGEVIRLPVGFWFVSNKGGTSHFHLDCDMDSLDFVVTNVSYDYYTVRCIDSAFLSKTYSSPTGHTVYYSQFWIPKYLVDYDTGTKALNWRDYIV